ncbi:hypothetical protein B0H11DRAFT_1922683 [Mycena galericulata]|nr:hypothetical protein B0H11DRAFT_1922683 [Mycena galericulata]
MSFAWGLIEFGRGRQQRGLGRDNQMHKRPIGPGLSKNIARGRGDNERRRGRDGGRRKAGWRDRDQHWLCLFDAHGPRSGSFVDQFGIRARSVPPQLSTTAVHDSDETPALGGQILSNLRIATLHQAGGLQRPSEVFSGFRDDSFATAAHIQPRERTPRTPIEFRSASPVRAIESQVLYLRPESGGECKPEEVV